MKHPRLLSISVFLCIILLTVTTPSFAALDGDTYSLANDASIIESETQTLLPCPLHKGVAAIKALCVETIFISYMHKSKVIEYMPVAPPERVFAIYFEGVSHPGALLGSDAVRKAYKAFLDARKAYLKAGPYAFYRRTYGVLVVDTRHVPDGLDVRMIAPE